jgi:hypothetical protein
MYLMGLEVVIYRVRLAYHLLLYLVQHAVTTNLIYSGIVARAVSGITRVTAHEIY